MIQVPAGYYLSWRLGEVRARDYFAISDYFSSPLLDELIEEPRLIASQVLTL